MSNARNMVGQSEGKGKETFIPVDYIPKYLPDSWFRFYKLELRGGAPFLICYVWRKDDRNGAYGWVEIGSWDIYSCHYYFTALDLPSDISIQSCYGILSPDIKIYRRWWAFFTILVGDGQRDITTGDIQPVKFLYIYESRKKGAQIRSV